jgi:hydroxyethylthiazole kinase-like uncharacterized protein yjeF
MLAGYRVAAIREAEERAFAALGPDVLMQRAAAGLATAILRRLDKAYGARALLVLGSGNNGGDALYAGVRLLRRGVAVSAWPVGGRVHEAGWAAFLAAGGRVLDASAALAVLARQDLVVDGVAGIGSRPGLADEVAVFASSCAEAGVPVVAVDLPSGSAPEPPFSGEPCFSADLTVTFGGLKLCQLLEPARSACGVVELVDIGLELGEPAVLQWEVADLAAHWPVPGVTSDKYSRGVVGLDTGSTDFPGAAVLGTSGAVHAGAGMVRCLGASEVAAKVIERFPNVVPAPGRVQSLVLGSGWGERRDGSAVPKAVESGLPLVVDADALRHLPEAGGHAGVLLTPHAGELAWLLGCDRTEVTADPIAAVLKGGTQYVAVPGSDRVQVAVPGPAWTAQAGSGDTLAGICGSLLAAGLDPADAALAAASVQALAASEHPGPLPPQELAALLPAVIAGLVAHAD